MGGSAADVAPRQRPSHGDAAHPADPPARIDPLPGAPTVVSPRHGPGAAGLGWVGLALAILGIALIAVLPFGLGADGGRSSRLVGYLALVTAAFAAVAGIVFDRARTAALVGLVVALAGFVLIAVLPR